MKLQPAGAGDAWRIKVSGLKGGHSGVDIHQGRGNAVRILGMTLQSAAREAPGTDCRPEGGSAQNAIPREASATVVLDRGTEQELRSIVAESQSPRWKSDLGGFDPGLQITVEKATRPQSVLDGKARARRLICWPACTTACSP